MKIISLPSLQWFAKWFLLFMEPSMLTVSEHLIIQPVYYTENTLASVFISFA